VRLFAVFAVLFSASLAFSGVVNLGKFGAVYPIEERDALEELAEAASKVDWAKIFDPQKFAERVKNFRPPNLKKVPRAARERVRLVDLTWTLPFDIPKVNEHGEIVGVLYPQGYTFSPLDYVTYPGILVILDGEDHLQLAWFERSSYFDDPKVRLLITQGSWYELSEKYKRPVFYAASILLDRLKIERVPSVVRQKGRYMEVREVDVEKELKKSRRASPGASAASARGS